jgi:hypothetical protein
MSYAQFGLIEATDYNNLIGANPGSTANALNTVWSTGSASAGYGQTGLSNVTVGATVAASEWANLVNRTSNAATHQGSSLSSVTAPSTGGTITYLGNVVTNLQTIYTNRLNASTQSSTSSNAVTRGTTWSTNIVFTHTATFANGDAARYFFNSGGQLAITCSHPNTADPQNQTFNSLATAIGTVVLSAMSSGTATIVGTSYSGVTKVGGSGSPTVNSNNGYYAWSTSNANCFTQTAGSGLYTNSLINVTVKTNGTQGSNSDRGSVVTIYTTWDVVPDVTIGSGSVTTLTVRPPEVTNISNTWGTITLAGSVA